MKRRIVWLAAALWLAVLLGPAAALAQDGAVVRGGTVTFPAFEVNIDDGGRLGRLRIGFEVLLTDEQSAKLAASGQVREALLLFFRDQTAAALLAPRGKEVLRAELLRQINAVIGGPRAIKLYFLDYLVIRAEKP